MIRHGTLVQTLGRSTGIRGFSPDGTLVTNLVTDPRLTSLTDKDVSNATLSLLTSYPTYGTALRATRNSVSVGRLAVTIPNLTWSTSKTYTAVLTVNVSSLVTGATFTARTAPATSAGQVTWRTGNLPAGESTYTVSGAGPASGGTFAIISSGGVAATLDLVRLMIVEGTWSDTHRDGSSPGWVWDGTVDASTSSGRT